MSLIDLTKEESEKYLSTVSLEDILSPVHLEDKNSYFKHFRENYLSALRIEAPCITACEAGEFLGYTFLRPVIGNLLAQVVSLATGALTGASLAKYSYMGEKLKHQKGGHCHEHEDKSFRSFLKQTKESFNRGRREKKRLNRAIKNAVTDEEREHLLQEKKQLDQLSREGFRYTLYSEMFGCIGAAELTAFIASNLFNVNNYDIVSWQYAAIWVAAIIPAYAIASGVINHRMVKDKMKEERGVADYVVLPGSLEKAYEVALDLYGDNVKENKNIRVYGNDVVETLGFEIGNENPLVFSDSTPSLLAEKLSLHRFSKEHPGKRLVSVSSGGANKDELGNLSDALMAYVVGDVQRYERVKYACAH